MKITIDRSADRDLRGILRWLKREYEDNEREDGFWCNRRLISASHRDGKLVVLREDDKVVAFQLEGDILEVRPDKRGKGYGRILAGLWIESARSRDEVYLFIECAPHTSLSFWQTMGFREIETELHGLHAYRVLNKRFKLDDDAESVDVEISFYSDEQAKSLEDVQPLSTHRPKAVKDGNKIKLAERVIGIQFCQTDLVVRIQVGDEVLYFDKAKYPEAKAMGIQPYREQYYRAFYCDSLTLPAAA